MDRNTSGAPGHRRLQRLDRLLSRPTWSYLLRFGVLGWGVPTALVFTAVMAFLRESWQHWLLMLPLTLLIFGLGGLLFGAAMRRTLERQQRRLRESLGNDPE